MKPVVLTQDEIDTIAARWIARRDAGLTPAESAAFTAWRDADPRHAAALQRFDATWASLGHPRHSGRAPDLSRAVAALARRQARRRVTLATAAFLAVGAFLGPHLVPDHPTLPPTPVTAQVIHPERRVLPDGSTAVLKSGATLTVHFDHATRRIRLERGEAHFEVASQPSRPFVVEAGEVSVRAVGTAFAVNYESGTVDVIVTHGKISVAAAELSTPPVFAEAGQHVAVPAGPSSSAGLQVATLPRDEIDRRLAWRSPQLEFSGTALAEVIATVNRLTPADRPRFVIDDVAIGRIPLSGRFRIDDPTALGRLLGAGFGIVAEPRPDRTILLRPRRPGDAPPL
jgi:transmembrane sensor